MNVALVREHRRTRDRHEGPATFVHNDSGRIEVRLGSQVVGMIEPWQVALPRDYGAFFWLTLPINGERDEVHPASRRHAARWMILLRLADWFADAGEMGQTLAVQLRRQAEDEKRARQ